MLEVKLKKYHALEVHKELDMLRVVDLRKRVEKSATAEEIVSQGKTPPVEDFQSIWEKTVLLFMSNVWSSECRDEEVFDAMTYARDLWLEMIRCGIWKSPSDASDSIMSSKIRATEKDVQITSQCRFGILFQLNDGNNYGTQLRFIVSDTKQRICEVYSMRMYSNEISYLYETDYMELLTL